MSQAGISVKPRVGAVTDSFRWEEMSQSDAVQACAAVGAALVVPSSQVEFDEFHDRTNVDQEEGGFSWSSVWIGCGDEEVEGMYACTDGTEIPENSGECLP